MRLKSFNQMVSYRWVLIIIITSFPSFFSFFIAGFVDQSNGFMFGYDSSVFYTDIIHLVVNLFIYIYFFVFVSFCCEKNNISLKHSSNHIFCALTSAKLYGYFANIYYLYFKSIFFYSFFSFALFFPINLVLHVFLGFYL